MLFATAALVFTSFAGVPTSEAVTPGAAKPVLTIGWNLDPGAAGGLSPLTGSDFFMNYLAYDNLIKINPAGTLLPGLAASWHFVGSGNREFDFTLRHDARFSDGSLVTARAVKTWLADYFKSGAEKSYMPPMQWISTVGKWGIRMKLKAPQPNVPLLFSYGSEASWGQVASPRALTSPSSLESTTDGAGPYKLVPSQTTSGATYTYVPNPYYYDKSAIKWSKIVVKIITSPTSMLEALKSGEVDVAIGDPATQAAAKSAGFAVFGSPEKSPVLGLNVTGSSLPALAKLDVRRALNYAINRPQLARLLGKGVRPTDELAGAFDGFDPRFNNYYTYNPTKAKALLAKAGYPHGFTVTFLFDATATIYEDLGFAIAQQLKAIGLDVKTEAATTSSQLGAAFSATGPPMWLCAQCGFDSTYNYYVLFLQKGGVGNQEGGGFNDPVINGYIAKGLRARNPVPYWKAVIDRAVKQAYYLQTVQIPGYWYENTKKVKGVNELGGPTLGRLPEAVNPTRWSPA